MSSLFLSFVWDAVFYHTFRFDLNLTSLTLTLSNKERAATTIALPSDSITTMPKLYDRFVLR